MGKRLGPVHSPVVSRILLFFKGVLGRHAFFVFSCLTVFQASSGTTCVPIRFFLFLWAWRGDGSASVAEFVGQGKHWRTFGVLFFFESSVRTVSYFPVWRPSGHRQATIECPFGLWFPLGVERPPEVRFAPLPSENGVRVCCEDKHFKLCTLLGSAEPIFWAHSCDTTCAST